MFFGRGKNKIQNPYILKDIYSFYINDIGSNELYFVEYIEYCNIVSDFYKVIMDAILRKNIIFKFPFNMGTFSVVKKKICLYHLGVNGIDWPKTVATGKHVYHLNEHSKGYKYLFFWNKTNRSIKNLYFYRLVPTRTNKRSLAKLVKNNRHDYFEVQ